jgi:cephalosporin-C deacetylase
LSEASAPPIPEDLDEFWEDTTQAALQAPLEIERKASDRARPGFRVDTVAFRGIDGSRRYGWVAVPEGASRAPGFLWVPPYGRWSMPPDDYGTRTGYVSLSLNFFGEGPFHEEAYTPARGYFADGAASPESWVFRRMYQDAVVALRVLEAIPEVDETRLAAMGLSQGGGMAIWLGAWCAKVKAVCADYPFLSGMEWVLGQQVTRYPLRELTDFMATVPLGRERVLHTVAYFDTVTQASRCRVPTLVTAGLRDPAVRPPQARAVFEALPGPKELAEIDWGHDWHPSMVERNRAWLDRWL